MRTVVILLLTTIVATPAIGVFLNNSSILGVAQRIDPIRVMAAETGSSVSQEDINKLNDSEIVTRPGLSEYGGIKVGQVLKCAETAGKEMKITSYSKVDDQYVFHGINSDKTRFDLFFRPIQGGTWFSGIMLYNILGPDLTSRVDLPISDPGILMITVASMLSGCKGPDLTSRVDLPTIRKH